MKRTLIDTLLLCIDTLEDFLIFLDEEKELHINDVIHVCNQHNWELISPMERLYGIYDRENDIHITFSISKENSFLQNYTNCEWCSPFPRTVHNGKPFIKRRIKHGHL